MQITPDILADRNKLKSKINRWRIIAIIALMLLISKLLPEDNYLPSKHADYIAKVKIEGVIYDDQDRIEMINDLADDNKVKALIIYINSPGGTFVGGESLYNAISKVRAKKPVIAVLGTIAASGGYMTAIAADKIYAYNGTITGSIGVIAHAPEFTGALDKLGIKVNVFKSGEYKGSPDSFEKVTPNIENYINNMIQDSYNIFVDMVAERRKMDKTDVLKLADGKVYTGKQAIKVKLVDEIGDENKAIEYLEQEGKIQKGLDLFEIDSNKKKSLIEELFDIKSNIRDKIFPRASIFNDYGLKVIWEAN